MSQDAGKPAAEQTPQTQCKQRFRFRSGSVVGYEHKRSGTAKQDAFVLGGVRVGEKSYDIGMVSDGCSAKEFGKKAHNEVGANLMCEFVSSEIAVLLGAGVRIEEVPSMLFARCIGYLRNLVGATKTGTPEAISEMVARLFLCTTLGFIADDERLVIFHDADGVIIVNDDVIVVDQNNRPTYLGFHLVDEATVQKYGIKRPQGFIVRSYDIATVKRFAIATDGITERKTPSLELVVKPEDVAAIWSYQPQAKAGLQWWLNTESNFNGRFEDDTTIIAAEFH